MWGRRGWGGSSPFVLVQSGCLHQLTDVRAFMLKHFKEYSANMFPCVQVSMIDQRHAYLFIICVQACTEIKGIYSVCTVYTEGGCTMVYIYIYMFEHDKSQFLVILISFIWLSHLVYFWRKVKKFSLSR